MSRKRAPCTSQQPALGAGEVDIARYRCKSRAVLIANDDELFKFPGLAMESIKPPNHYTVAEAQLDIRKQALILRPRSPGAVCTAIVIDVHFGNAPTAACGLR